MELKLVFVIITLWITPTFQQPRIFTNNGNLHISPALDKNIIFRCEKKSSFFINDLNVLESLSNITKKYEDRYQGQSQISRDIENIRSVLHTINSQINLIANRTQSSTFREVPRIQRRCRNLLASVRSLEADIAIDECLDGPCKNGGTCIDLHKRFHCICKEGWTGHTCEEDVDECYHFSGTDLGCQNKADCINTPGSYRCHCKDGYGGAHCLQRSSSCSQDFCFHGFCVPGNSNGNRFSCICDQGWAKSEDSGLCSVDIDECETSNPCHTNCTNLPGSFTCGPCPRGYEGSGYFCRDVNECEVNNGGCNLSPKVQCINTEGSHHCGTCPPGWAGDGKFCTPANENTCASSSLCHPQATCQYISNTAVCVCPDHMTGSGFGPSGCVIDENNPCKDKPCKNNGTCIARGQSFTCLCEADFYSPRCERRNPCSFENPCKNGGICAVNQNDTRLFTCTCPEEFVGISCERTIGQCGGFIREPTGTIKYPFEGNYHPSRRCAWFFYLSYPKVLNLTFTKFDLEEADESGDCTRDFLQIHDGLGSQTHILGRFCGKKDLGSIITSDRMLYMYFSSNNNTERSGFEMNWEMIDIVCGGNLREPSGLIQSPGFPGKSPPKRDCKWRIEAPFGKRILFKFFKVEFENSLNCTADHLIIFDGTDNLEESVIEKICLSSTPQPVHSTSHIAIVSFHADSFKSDSAFNLHYEFIDDEPDCGGLHSDTKGSFNIFSRSSCEFLIKVPDGFRIKLSLENHELREHGFICSFNFFDVIDGSLPENPLIERYCLGYGKKTYVSSNNTILIKVTAKLALSRIVLATYEVECSKVFTDSEGLITTPNYPKLYNKDITCTFIIQVDLNKRLRLEFEDFDLPMNKSVDGTCLPEEDYLEVQLNIKETRRYCTDRPNTLYSDNNFVKLIFNSGKFSSRGRGFRLNYKTEMEMCGGVLNAPNGTVHHLPMESVGTVECKWIIQAKERNYIRWTLLSKDFDVSDKSYFKVYSNDSYKGDRLLKSYTNNELVTQSPIVFFSDILTIQSLGFKGSFQYETVNPGDSCGGNLTQPSGLIETPFFPTEYPESIFCEWVITGPTGHQIELKVLNFSIEVSYSCQDDNLEIHNGPSRESPLIGKFCGNEIPKVIPSFTNHLYLRFKSDSSIESSGFQIEYEQTSTGCGGKLDSYEGSIHSPQYPAVISDDMQCDWFITVNPGSTIDFSITGHRDLCNPGMLALYDKKDFNRPLTFNCSNDKITLKSETNMVHVKYTTNTESDTKAFLLEYKANCNAIIDQPFGTIESPNFPGNYPPNLKCEWKIISPRSNTIKISFSHVDFEMDSYMPDYLEVIDMKNNEEIKSTKYNQKPSKDITTSGNNVVIRFVSDFALSNSGFRLEFTREGCGGHIKSASGNLVTPNFPYSDYVDCEWFLEVDPGNTIVLMIRELEIDADTDDCNSNALIVAEDKSVKNVFLKECKVAKMERTITSSGSTLYIRFFTDEVRSRKNFRANFYTRTNDCGGLLRGNKGVIRSPNYPLAYPNKIVCEWTIIIEDTFRMRLHIDKIDLSNNCTNEFIEVRDYFYNKLIKKVCNNDDIAFFKNNTLTNDVKIVFRSGMNTGNHTGFSLRYDKVCGRIGEIEGGNQFIRASAQEEVCEWSFTAKEDHARITFTPLRIECDCGSLDRRKCSETKGVTVYEGSAIKASFCDFHPHQITSNGQTLKIVSKNAAFRGTLSTFDNTCGGILSSVSGSFASPLYPNSYPLNTECEWEIKAESGNFIELSFIKMDIVSSENCNSDYLEIREGNNNGKVVGLFCSKEIPDNIKIYETVWVKFRSGDSMTSAGFLVNYRYAFKNEITGKQKGSIVSPNVDSIRSKDVPYSWRIMVPFGNRIMMYFKEYNKGLELYDGYNKDALKVEIQLSPFEFTSSQSVVYLISNNQNLEEFKIDWTMVSKDLMQTINNCSYTRIVGSGARINLTTPGYPYGYEENLNCSWTFIPEDKSRHVVLEVYDVFLESDTDCTTDYVKVMSSNNLISWHDEQKFCNNKTTRNFRFPVAFSDGTPNLKVDFITDASINATGMTSLVKTTCGSNLTDPIGEILVDLQNATVRRIEKECVWHIEVRPSRRIKFMFNFTEDSFSKDCETYALLKDGLDENAPYLGSGRICKREDALKDLITTGNRAYVKYHFDRSLNDRLAKKFLTWTLQYEEYNDCGGEVRLTKFHPAENITTPNYPNIPNANTECVWIIIAPPSEIIQVSFVENFDLNFIKCSKEYVQLRDGSTELSKDLGRFCRKPTGTIFSSSNVMYMKFFTNIPEPRNGFKALFKIPECIHEYKSERGSVSSDNYPNPGAYKPYMVCEYFFNYAPSQRVNFTFTDIDLPFNGSAVNNSDMLVIFNIFMNNGNRTEEEIYRINGNTSVDRIPSIISDSHTVMVRFYTFKPTVKKYRGFKFYFKRVFGPCSRDVVDSNGELYLRNLKSFACIWKITVPKGQRVKLMVDELETANPNVTVRLRFFDDFEMSVPLASYNGATAENIAPISSTDNQMLILVNQNRVTGGAIKFLKVHWTSDEESICPNHSADDSEGSLFFQNNRDNLKCTSNFKVNQNETLAFKIDELIMRGVSQNIRFSSYPEAGVKIGIVNLKTNITSEVFPVTGIFNRFSILQRNTSSPKLISLKGSFKKHPCGGIFTNLDTSILALAKIKDQIGIPNQNYGEIDCFWQVWTTSTLNNITITPRVQMTGNCDEEYLKFYRGNSVRSPILKTICGENSTVVPWTMTNTFQVSIHYHAKNYQPGKNVEVVVAKTFNCGGKFRMPTGSSFELHRINFERKDYRNNLECVWDISTNHYYNLDVKFFNRFFIESSPNCTKDYLEIRTIEGNNEIANSTRYCGRTIPQTFVSTSNQLQIVFRSDNNITADGFNIDVRPKCGGIYNVTNKSPKTIRFKNIDDFSDNSLCNFTLVTDSEHTIVVRFIPVTTRPMYSQSVDCVDMQNVNVYKWEKFMKKLEYHGKFCIRSLEKQFFAQTQILLQLNLKGFAFSEVRMEYYLESCRDVVRSPGWIYSPKGRDSLHECEWKIEAPENHRIKLSFENFNVGNTFICRYSYQGVQIYKGNDTEAIKICGKFNETKVIKIQANTGSIKYFSPYTDQIDVFKVNVEFIKMCDENIVLKDSKPVQLLKQRNDTDNYECNYYISAHEGYRIEVELKEAKMLMGEQQCKETYIELYEGHEVHQGLIQKLCRNEPTKFISPENQLNILAKGRTLNFFIEMKIKESWCGSNKIILLNDTKAETIQMSSYPANTYCKWTVKSDSYFDIIVDYLDLEPRSDVTGKCLDELSINSFTDASSYTSTGSNIHKFCGNESGQAIHVQYENFLPEGELPSKAEIIFKSNEQIEGKGFNLRIIHSKACSREYNEIFGQISMGPTKNATCIDYIKVPENYTISLFTSNGFDVLSSGCRNNITIFDEKRKQKIIEKCNSDISEALPIFANTNHIRIERNIYFIQTLTYIASEKGLGCGGKLSLSKGSFASPMYPLNDRASQSCRWELSTSIGTIFRIHFARFEMGSKAYCEENYIKFLEVQPNGEEKEARTYCGGENQADFISSGNKVVVVYKKTQNFDGTGWLIKYATETSVINDYTITKASDTLLLM
ncbi:hypothetical protein ACFFRR_000221 [Megaselia abdita]